MKVGTRRLAQVTLGVATLGVLVTLGTGAAGAKKGDGRPVDGS